VVYNGYDMNKTKNNTNNRRETKEVLDKREQEIIKLENKILAFVIPITGIILFLFGFLGFILIIANKDAILAVVNENGDPLYTESQIYTIVVILILFGLLGAGGIAYGIVKLLTISRNKYKKKEVEPVQTLE